jgi:hypothetical protein
MHCADNVKQSASQCRAHNSSYHYFEDETPACLKVIGKNTRNLIALNFKYQDGCARANSGKQLVVSFLRRSSSSGTAGYKN